MKIVSIFQHMGNKLYPKGGDLEDFVYDATEGIICYTVIEQFPIIKMQWAHDLHLDFLDSRPIKPDSRRWTP